jgi:hypothetical protein
MKLGRPTRARAGFSLLELCLSFALLVAILGMVGVVQMSSAGLLTTTSTNGLLHESAMHALEVIASEMRWAEAASVIASAQNGSSRLDFKTPVGYAGGNPIWSTNITYMIVPAAIDWNSDGVINEGRFIRLQDGKQRVLCDYVIPGGFTAVLAGQNVSLQLRLTKVNTQTSDLLSANEQTSISLRN